MSIKQVTPDEAHQLVEAGSRYVDVRTEEEFAAGHPTPAVNIPVAMPHPASGQMQLNDDFVAVVEAHFPKDTALLLGCLSGGRSQHAAQMLEQAGYTNLSNVRGGYGGQHDPMGRSIVPGWAEQGLPTSRECTDANSYESLKTRAGR